MVKEKKILIKTLILLFMLSMLILPNFVYAVSDGWLPDKVDSINPSDDFGIATKATSLMGTAQSVVFAVGTGLAVVILIIIGIKYMTSAPEGRAEYKKYLLPYVIGVALVYGASWIVGQIASANGDISAIGDVAVLETKKTMNIVETVIRVVGFAMATITLMILGIKYMTSAPEGKAEFRKTAVPYVVGAIIVFGASQIIAIIAGGMTDSGINGNAYVSNAQTIMGTIINVITVIGVGTAIIILIVLAIQYMTSAPDGKAEFRKTAVPYIVGAIVLFAAVGIVNIIHELSTNIGEYNDNGELITTAPNYMEQNINENSLIQLERDQTQSRLEKKRKELNNTQDENKKQKLNEEINSLQERLNQLNAQLIEGK